MMKNKMLAIMLVVCVAMTATTFGGAHWNGTGADIVHNEVTYGDWNDLNNWDNGATPPVAALPNGGSTYIQNGESVLLSGTAGDTNKLYVDNGSTLTITTDLGSGDNLLMDTGGTVNMNAGTYTQDEKFKLNEGGGGATFIMNGGTVTVANKLEMYSGSVLELNGGSLSANDGDGVEFSGGTIRVNGSWTGTIYFKDVTASGGTYEFNPTVGGEITPITAGDSAPGSLAVNLDAAMDAGISTMTLFTGGSVGTFANVTIMHDTTEQTLGTEGALNVGEYYLDYTGGTGNDVVLTVNLPGLVDPCHAAKTAATPYTPEMAQVIGDTNYDCKVNLEDLAAMASNWLTVKTL